MTLAFYAKVHRKVAAIGPMAVAWRGFGTSPGARPRERRTGSLRSERHPVATLPPALGTAPATFRLPGTPPTQKVAAIGSMAVAWRGFGTSSTARPRERGECLLQPQPRKHSRRCAPSGAGDSAGYRLHSAACAAPASGRCRLPLQPAVGTLRPDFLARFFRQAPVERYRSPVLQPIVTMVLPLFSGRLAIWIAACTFAPLTKCRRGCLLPSPADAP